VILTKCSGRHMINEITSSNKGIFPKYQRSICMREKT